MKIMTGSRDVIQKMNLGSDSTTISRVTTHMQAIQPWCWSWCGDCQDLGNPHVPGKSVCNLNLISIYLFLSYSLKTAVWHRLFPTGSCSPLAPVGSFWAQMITLHTKMATTMILVFLEQHMSGIREEVLTHYNFSHLIRVKQPQCLCTVVVYIFIWQKARSPGL